MSSHQGICFLTANKAKRVYKSTSVSLIKPRMLFDVMNTSIHTKASVEARPLFGKLMPE